MILPTFIANVNINGVNFVDVAFTSDNIDELIDYY